tara:strand:+ start:268 stop:738 length:471 start_codon:yes stop_codon:yes gene_type:complete
MEVQGFPNYLIYQDGRMWSNKTNRFLKPSFNNKGYLFVGLRNNGKSYTKYIHRLMGIHYIANPNNYSQIDHIDRNKTNNHIDNLRWVSNIQNQHNKGKTKNNISGIKNIQYRKEEKLWNYYKNCNKITYVYSNKNKQIVLWVKFIHSLSIKRLFKI